MSIATTFVLTLSRSEDRCAADGARHKARRALRLRPHGRGADSDVFKSNEVKTSASFSFGLRPPGANLALCRPGGSGGVAAPVPIPNTAVKRPSADGTSS